MRRNTNPVLAGQSHIMPPAAPEKISEFEHETGFQLPRQYRAWLQISDGAELMLPDGIRLFGVSHKLLVRLLKGRDIETESLVIGEMPNGDQIICQSGDGEISIVSPETERCEGRFANFDAFMSAIAGMEESA